jgi:hypothetical protein
MVKKFAIKEAWLLDDNGDKLMKLTPLNEHEIPSLITKEDVRGGCGNIVEDEVGISRISSVLVSQASIFNRTYEEAWNDLHPALTKQFEYQDVIDHINRKIKMGETYNQ